MKFLISQLTALAQPRRQSRQNIRILLRFVVVLVLVVTLYSVVFHYLMAYEGRDFTWITGLYWTLTVMSTLGFGDITFTDDAGRAFSMIVLLSGIVFLLVLLPFTFIEFFYAPWMRAQAAARMPRTLPEETRGHVILTNLDPVTESLIEKLEHHSYEYVLIESDLNQGLQLRDRGYRVLLGNFDDPGTYRRSRVEQAALVVATGNDFTNTNIAFTVRELTGSVPIITTAQSADSVDILQLAGSSDVLRLDSILGSALARRTLAGDATSHVIGEFDELLIAEATAAGTPMVGKKILESQLRELTGVTVLGVWQGGSFSTASPETLITQHTVLVLAGSREQLDRYDALFCIYHRIAAPVIIIGGGRVGRAAARALHRERIDYRIIEVDPQRIRADDERYIPGSAADIEVLERAGIREAPAVVSTARADDFNIYVTIYCRRLRPDIQIVSRSTLERNVSTLLRAGADFVMSYSWVGSSLIFNRLRGAGSIMLTEGVNIFRKPVPADLANRSLAETQLRQKTGCSVVALRTDSSVEINPDPKRPLTPGAELILLGSVEAEARFAKRYGEAASRS